MTFTRMDNSTAAEWAAIGGEVAVRQGRMPATIKSMLAQLEAQVDGFEINQLQHCLQTATRAERGGASEEMVVAALCHDIGKAVSIVNHPAIAAEILKPYVSRETCEVIRAHQDFQGKHYYAFMGMDADARRKHENKPWYALAARFADEWDQNSFDPGYDTLPLEHFEPLLQRVFSKDLIRLGESASRSGR